MNKELEFINAKGESFKIGYYDPYFLTGFDGNGTPQVNVYTSKSLNRDGEIYVSSTMNMRNIIVDFDITESFMESKSRLYKLVKLKEKCTLVYRQGDVERKVDCFVELMDINEKEIDRKSVQLSLLCPKPFWSDLNYMKTEIALWLPMFEFELEFSSEGIDFGIRSESLVVNVVNDGHTTCPMIVKFNALNTVVNPKIYDVYQQKWIEIDYTMMAGDVITIDTNEMEVKLIKHGIEADITNFLTYESEYLMLSEGDNLLRYSAEENQDSLEISIYFSPRYLGV